MKSIKLKGSLNFVESGKTTSLGLIHYGEVSFTLLDSTKEYIIQINPFLYRGYYYDKESSLFYLLSKYYDPRFKHWHYYFCLLAVLLGKDEENDGL